MVVPLRETSFKKGHQYIGAYRVNQITDNFLFFDNKGLH